MVTAVVSKCRRERPRPSASRQHVLVIPAGVSISPRGSTSLHFLKNVHTFPTETEPRHASTPAADINSPPRVGVREFRGNLTSFLKQVEEGQRFVLTSHHKVVAEIGPPSSDVVIRKPGALRGKIKVADDFDSLPEDVLKSVEDGT